MALILHIQGKSEFWNADEHWTLHDDGRHIRWSLSDRFSDWTFKGRLPDSSESEKMPEKTIEFVNMYRNPKVVEIHDGTAGTGDACDTNDYITTKQVDGGSIFVLPVAAT